jgi:murein tripeptide amidase MpaA
VPASDVCYYASWAPYPLDRELDLIARVAQSSRVRVAPVARTVMGADVDLLTIGEAGPGKRTCWIIARQHPSESMSGYFLEGMLPRLVDEHDPVARQLLDRAVIHVVPNMNPDGTRLGHTRGNGAGANLNREWADPSPDRSPEVFAVRAQMEATGVDFFMDCHGDEELRCVFLGGPLEIPSRTPRLASLFGQFERAWMAVSPEYELGHGYPGGPPETADLRMAWNWVAERFGCLGVLLEQPFKDTSWATDPVRGWSPQRATLLGHSFPAALNQVVAHLR